MLELKGKYNTANVYTDNIDASAIGQIISLCNLDVYKDNKIRIMPDCHAGVGCTVGTTMTIKDAITPNLVGVDIGCGMLAIKLKEKRIDLPAFDSVIRKFVPSGAEVHKHNQNKKTPFEDMRCIKNGANIRVELAYKSVGTLGGGNHFIELDKDDEDNIWLVIHTGSRHLGIEVCMWYQKMAYKELLFKANNGDIKTKTKELADKLKAEGKTHGMNKVLEDFRKNYTEIKPDVPFELAYCTGQLFEDYIHDMKLVQEHASVNRETIAKLILKNAKLHEVERFETIHNYIDTENMIMRKGSISAQKGEKVLIPINMRDGSLVCIGKGNPDWNYSAPHGAGRLFSRSETKERFSLTEYKKTMKEAGVYTSSVSSSTLDECPMAYKPMEEILNNIKETVEIQAIIKPIYNFKAGSGED